MAEWRPRSVAGWGSGRGHRAVQRAGRGRVGPVRQGRLEPGVLGGAPPLPAPPYPRGRRRARNRRRTWPLHHRAGPDGVPGGGDRRLSRPAHPSPAPSGGGRLGRGGGRAAAPRHPRPVVGARCVLRRGSRLRRAPVLRLRAGRDVHGRDAPRRSAWRAGRGQRDELDRHVAHPGAGNSPVRGQRPSGQPSTGHGHGRQPPRRGGASLPHVPVAGDRGVDRPAPLRASRRLSLELPVLRRSARGGHDRAGPCAVGSRRGAAGRRRRAAPGPPGPGCRERR